MQKKIILNMKVVLNSFEFKIVDFDQQTKTLKIRVKSRPELGLANKEIEKNLSKFFSSNTKIVFGKKSKNKKILIQSEEKFLEKIKNL